MNEASRYEPNADEPLLVIQEEETIHRFELMDSRSAGLRDRVKESLHRKVGAKLMEFMGKQPTGFTVEVQAHRQVISTTDERGMPMREPDEKHLLVLKVYRAKTRGAVEIIVSQQELKQWNGIGAVVGLESVSHDWRLKCPECHTSTSAQFDLNDLTRSPRGELDISFDCYRCRKRVPAVAKIERPPSPSAPRLKNVSKTHLIE